MNELKETIRLLKRKVNKHSLTEEKDWSSYKYKPVEFFYDALGFRCTPQQAEIARSLLVPPYRTLAMSANAQGKSAVSAMIAIWWFWTRRPAKVITTAPTLKGVRDIVWSEIRSKVAQFSPITRMNVLSYDRGPEDYMVGMTAKDSTSFQGRHGSNLLFIFDESTKIRPEFFEVVQTMFKGEGHAWLCLFNPTDSSTQIYQEVCNSVRSNGEKSWHLVKMSALEHPNIIAGLQGLPSPVPNAMKLPEFERMFLDWSNVAGTSPNPAVDVLWPPPWAKDYITKTKRAPRWYTPGPLAESRLLARYARSANNNIWTDGDWQMACRIGMPPLPIPKDIIPHVGCDTAGSGEAFCVIHTRCGPCSLSHSEANGLRETTLAGWIIDTVRKLAAWYNAENRSRENKETITEFDIPIKIDNSSYGNGTVDILKEQRYNVVAIMSQRRAVQSTLYPNRRSELWFATAALARREEIDLSRLPQNVLEMLRPQLCTPTWSFDAQGRRVVQDKEDIMKMIGRSPDSADGMNLCYCYDGSSNSIPEVNIKKANSMVMWGRPNEQDQFSQGHLHDRLASQMTVVS